MENVFEDLASLQDWFYENDDCFIMPYIEKHFKPESWSYQHFVMSKNLYFAKKIIEDDLLSNDDKEQKLLDSVSFGKSKIIVIEGARGSGKTATAAWVMDELHKRQMHSRIYFVKKGERPKGFPKFIRIVQEVEDVKNGSIAIIDESAIKFNNRNAWKDDNKDFLSRLVILRHKNISVILITQHMKMIDIGIRRLADIKIYKLGANLTSEDEMQNDQRKMVRERLKPRDKPECLVEISITSTFFKFNHGLPDWYSDEVSKSFEGFNPEGLTKQNRMEKMQWGKQKIKEQFEQQKELEILKLEKMKELGLAPQHIIQSKIEKKKEQKGGLADLI